ncbi:MAG TPA: hypothetical protein PK876_06330 [Elusimicrobiota bacterium]|nr:hypothetical protein [Elusimicrobiota bacterium]
MDSQRSSCVHRFAAAFVAGGFLLGFLAVPSRAADTGQFQLVIAAPDPVMAGERVQFQSIAVNKGTAVWRAKRYYLQAEVYTSDKIYLGRTERFKGTKDIRPGESLLTTLSFEVPPNYVDKYLYKVFVVHDETRVLESDFQPFQVKERPIIPPKPPAMALGGNVIASYKNATGAEEFAGNVSVNLVGRAKERTFLFNTYTTHDPNDSIDFYTILLNYYGPWVTAGLGDVSPSFSALSLYGQGMRGALGETKAHLGNVGWNISAVGARVAAAEEGSSTSDGIYRRLLMGGKSEFLLPGRLAVSLNYVNAYDVDSSLQVSGPTVKPVDDKVMGGGFTWEIFPRVKIGGEYQGSSYQENKLSTVTAVTDSAWRTFVGYEGEKLNINGYVQRTGPDFVALGAPNATKDRMTYDAGLSLTPVGWFNVYGSFNSYSDNLRDDPSVVTTTQQIMSSGISFNLPTQTGLNLGYSVNTAVGDPRTAQDNETLTSSVGLSQTLWGQTVSLSYQSSEFTDKTLQTNDLLTNTLGSSLNLALGGRVSSSIGVTTSSTEDQVDASVQDVQSVSISVNYEMIKNKFYSQIWGTMNSTTDNDLVNKADNQTTSANLEFTVQATANTVLTLGGYQNKTKDVITPTNDTTSNGMNMRVSYSF